MREDARQQLLAVARAAIAAHLDGSRMPAARLDGGGSLCSSVFVTLRDNGRVRGCIGRLDAHGPLDLVVAECAVSAAVADPRFPPVLVADLARLALEVSVLGPREAIRGPDDVEVGRHGLVVESGLRRGLLLPQVAVEWGWDAARFVAETCRKAGLSPDAWRAGARLSRFEAEVFGEGSLFDQPA